MKEIILSLAQMNTNIKSLYVICQYNKVILYDTNLLDLLKVFLPEHLDTPFEVKHYYRYYRKLKKENILIEKKGDREYTLQKLI